MANSTLRNPTCKCVLCSKGQFDTSVSFYSNISNKEYKVDVNIDVSCKTKMFVYLLRCKHPGCEMTYVGMSTTTVRKRMYGHRGNLLAGKEPHLLQHHFTKVHKPSDMIIQIIDVGENSKSTREKENYWMREINSIYPYGLNDRTDIKGVHDAYDHVMNGNTNVTIYSVFNKVVKGRGKKGSGSNRNLAPSLDFQPDAFLRNIIDSTGNHFKFARNSIMSLSKVLTKDLYLFIIRSMENGKYIPTFNEYFMFMMKDICLFKLQRYYKEKPVNNNFMVVKFSNKLVENVNLKRILDIKEIKKNFPIQNEKIKSPNITYSYTKTIRSNIVNYKDTILNYTDNSDIQCCCKNYPQNFTDTHHKHIYTGDLDIVSNVKLKSLLEKGLNYRDQQSPSKDLALDTIQSAIDNYIHKISTANRIEPDKFKKWKSDILSKVKNKLRQINSYKYFSVLQDEEAKSALKKLQSDFVLTPLDKAGNNVSFVCKKFYVDTLIHEIENSSNFILSSDNEEDIVNYHKQFYETVRLPMDTKCEKLPFLYWTSKMHKNPTSFRFITCGTSSSISYLSEKVGYALKVILKFVRNSSQYNSKYKCYNSHYIIDDRQKVVSFLNKANRNRKYGGSKSIKTYDFSNLYTSIPHDKLKVSITSFVMNAYGEKNKKFINVINDKAYFSDVKSNKSSVTFTSLELIEAIKFIIDNSFVKFNGKIYRQIIGIPMGTSCAPHLANIFLYGYEKSYIDKLIMTNKIKEAALLKDLFRYQDDLIVLNDKGYFDSVYKDIYPSELILKNTNTSANISNYLDLTISIVYGKFRYQLYDKRQDFPFMVINYPFINGNIPRVPSYGVYLSQIIRFCYLFSEPNSLTNAFKVLNQRFENQGFIKNTLKNKFILFLTKYPHVWCEFGIDMTSSEYINDIF